MRHNRQGEILECRHSIRHGRQRESRVGRLTDIVDKEKDEQVSIRVNKTSETGRKSSRYTDRKKDKYVNEQLDIINREKVEQVDIQKDNKTYKKTIRHNRQTERRVQTER